VNKTLRNLICHTANFLEIILAVFAGVVVVLFFYEILICDDKICTNSPNTTLVLRAIQFCIISFGFIFSLKFFGKTLRRVKEEGFSIIIISLLTFLNYVLVATDINANSLENESVSLISIFLFFVVVILLLSERPVWEKLTSYWKVKITLVLIHLLSFNIFLEFALGLLIPIIISDIILSVPKKEF